MSGRSSIDDVRRLSPVSDGEAAAILGGGREELLAGLVQLPSGRGPRSRPVRHHRRRVLVLALAVVVAVATTAATWVVLSAPAQETTSVECVVAGADTIIPSTSGDPAHDCAVVLQRDSGTAPPPLVAYDNTQGGVTVLPRNAKAPPGWTRLAAQDVALIQLQTSLDDYVNGLNSACFDRAAATSLAQAKLALFGLTGWTVSVRDGSGSCTTGDIVDPGSKTVTLIPAAAATGTETTFRKLADKLRPLTQSCESLPNAVADVRSAADALGLSESTRTYELNAVTDDSLRCASIYETVGGTIFLTVRGPTH